MNPHNSCFVNVIDDFAARKLELQEELKRLRTKRIQMEKSLLPSMPNDVDGTSIVNFFDNFEKALNHCCIQKSLWHQYLRCKLNSKATKVYYQLTNDQCVNYDSIKAKILSTCNKLSRKSRKVDKANLDRPMPNYSNSHNSQPTPLSSKSKLLVASDLCRRKEKGRECSLTLKQRKKVKGTSVRYDGSAMQQL